MTNFINYSVLHSNRLLNSERSDKKSPKFLNLLARQGHNNNLKTSIPSGFLKRKRNYLKKRRLGYLLARLYKLNFLASNLLIKNSLLKLRTESSVTRPVNTVFNYNSSSYTFNLKDNKKNKSKIKYFSSYKNSIKKQAKKRKSNIIGIYLYNTFNNYYIVCFNPISRKILSFISCGMVYSLKRYNRKNKYTLELCGRRIALLLKNNNYKFAFLVLKSYFRKKFLKSTIKGLRFYRLRIRTVYDHRILPHNGCLKRKARRL